LEKITSPSSITSKRPPDDGSMRSSLRIDAHPCNSSAARPTARSV
jgi:hypothetical protein